MTHSALTCNQIVKEFSQIRAVDSLELTVPSGSVFGLLGPNGSGKTTTIRVALGVFKPDSGSVNLLGSSNPLAVRNRVGYLPEERGLYAKMRVLDQLAFLGTLRGLSPKEANQRAMTWLRRLDLEGRSNSLTNELSKGNQQKVQFASAVIHEPQAVILDEPFSGLDPMNTRLLKDLILELKGKGTTVILSTHRMDQVEAMCDTICLIHRGKAVLSGRLAEIKASYGKSTIALEYEGDATSLKGLPGVREVRDSGRSACIQMRTGADSQLILRALLDRVSVRAFRLEEPHIEEIYVEKVSDGEVQASQDSSEMKEVLN